MRIQIVYLHGIGDVIMLGPCLRQLHGNGWEIDLLVPRAVIDSHLLDHCPYIYRAASSFECSLDKRVSIFHKGFLPGEHKIDKNARELGIELEDRSLEVWIGDEIEETGKAMVSQSSEGFAPDPYLFLHNAVPLHPYHSWWGAHEWAMKNLNEFNEPNPWWTWNTGSIVPQGVTDINLSFVVLKYAEKRVLCSSVFVHAAEAMGLNIDCINYGNPDPKVRPLDMSKVANIREEGKFIRRNYEWVE